MNKDALKKSLHARVRLRPVARRFDGETELEAIDDEWIIEGSNASGVQIKNARTYHVTTLGPDHISKFVTDPDRSSLGFKTGFLVLTVQVFIGGNRLWIEPTSRPGEAV